MALYGSATAPEPGLITRWSSMHAAKLVKIWIATPRTLVILNRAALLSREVLGFKATGRNRMRKIVGSLFAGAMMLGAVSGSASAANMGDKMMGMMQCSSACSAEYLQCVGSAQKLASTPQEGLSQIAMNFEASTACGTAAMACQASCN